MCTDRRIERSVQIMLFGSDCLDIIFMLAHLRQSYSLSSQDVNRTPIVERTAQLFDELAAEDDGLEAVQRILRLPSSRLNEVLFAGEALDRAVAVVRPGEAVAAVAAEVRDLLQQILDDQPLTGAQEAFGLELFGELQVAAYAGSPYAAAL